MVSEVSSYLTAFGFDTLFPSHVPDNENFPLMPSTINVALSLLVCFLGVSGCILFLLLFGSWCYQNSEPVCKERTYGKAFTF
jgi:hypothetical protein